MNNEFKLQAHQLEEELMNGVDDQINRFVAQIVHRAYLFARQLKTQGNNRQAIRDMLSRIQEANVQESLLWIKEETMLKLNRYTKKLQAAISALDCPEKRNIPEVVAKQQPPQTPQQQLLMPPGPQSFTSLICPLCSKEYHRGGGMMLKHIYESHAGKTTRNEWECVYCDQLYDCSTAMAKHITSLHIIEKDPRMLMKRIAGLVKLIPLREVKQQWPNEKTYFNNH